MADSLANEPLITKLYNRRGSGGFAVEAALALAGEPYELIAVESAPSTPLPESFRAVNPWGQVPVLITANGTTITETAAMLVFVAARHPGPDIGPPTNSSDYARFLRWTTFLAVNVYEGTLRRIYPARYTTETGDAALDAVRQSSIHRVGEALQMIETELDTGGPFLLGSDMCLADVFLAMLFGWYPNQNGYECCAEVTECVAAHPVIAPIWQRNFDHRMKRKWGRGDI